MVLKGASTPRFGAGGLYGGGQPQEGGAQSQCLDGSVATGPTDLEDRAGHGKC